MPYELCAKRAELVQKFVPQSLVGIFLNERTRSTPLDPKLMFWCILYYLGAFGTVWLPYETRCKTGQTSAIVVSRSRFGIFRNERTRSNPTDILVCFVPFGCIRDRLVALRNSVQNGAELVQKFMPQSRVGIFRNERTRSRKLDPKLMVWCVSYYLVDLRNSGQNGPN